MSELRTDGFGVVDPEGNLLPATGNEPASVFAVLAYLLGIDEADLSKKLTAAGYRVVPVVISAAPAPINQEKQE